MGDLRLGQTVRVSGFVEFVKTYRGKKEMRHREADSTRRHGVVVMKTRRVEGSICHDDSCLYFVSEKSHVVYLVAYDIKRKPMECLPHQIEALGELND